MIIRYLATMMLLAAATADPVLAAEEAPVWFWFATCGGPLMKLEVCLDQNVIHQSCFPLCRAERSSVHSRGQEKRPGFLFTASRSIIWAGYRNEDNMTDPGQEIEGNIWLAGADPDAMILGVSFVSRGSICLEYRGAKLGSSDLNIDTFGSEQKIIADTGQVLEQYHCMVDANHQISQNSLVNCLIKIKR